MFLQFRQAHLSIKDNFVMASHTAIVFDLHDRPFVFIGVKRKAKNCNSTSEVGVFCWGIILPRHYNRECMSLMEKLSLFMNFG